MMRAPRSTGAAKGLNVLILHAHWWNRGDEAAVRAMVDSLFSRLPIRTMRIMLDEEFRDSRVETVGLYPEWRLGKLIYLDMVFTILTWGRMSLTRRGREFLRVLRQADVVFHAPGGPSIGDMYGGRLRDLPYLYRLFMAKIIKRKPLFFYAPSMGPFRNRYLNWLRKLILRNTECIIVREDISAGYLRDQLGLEALVTADSALQNTIEPNIVPDEGCYAIDDKCVGMVVTDLKWHPVYGRGYNDLGERILKAFVELGVHLVNEGYSILLIPQLFGKQSDAHLLEEIRNAIGQDNKVKLLPGNIDAYQQQALIARLFAMVSARYHPIVFSVKAGVPVIGVFYEHKAQGFMKAAGIEDYSVHVETISGTQLIRLFEQLERSYESLRRVLLSSSCSLREKSASTTEIIKEKLKELGLVS